MDEKARGKIEKIIRDRKKAHTYYLGNSKV
jgi:hypothetical protein